MPKKGSKGKNAKKGSRKAKKVSEKATEGNGVAEPPAIPPEKEIQLWAKRFEISEQARRAHR